MFSHLLDFMDARRRPEANLRSGGALRFADQVADTGEVIHHVSGNFVVMAHRDMVRSHLDQNLSLIHI